MCSYKHTHNSAVHIDACKAGVEKLNTVFQAASQEMYNAQQQAGGATDGGAENASGANSGDEVTDVDFEEVTDSDDNNK